jgi:hypothetical protein
MPWLIALLASLTFIPVPRHPFLLDDSLSEKAVLSYAHEHGWRYGKDIVFTYGPWGYLVTRNFFPHQHRVQMTVLALVSFFTALGVCLVAWQMKFFWRVLLVTVFIYLAANIDPRADLLIYSAILCWGWLCMVSSGGRLLFSALFFALVSIFGVMVKANFLLVVIFSTAVIASDNLLKGRAAIAFGLPLVLSAMFLAAWTLSGQSLEQLSALFANSCSIIQGYDQVVGMDAPSTFTLRGAIAAVLALGAVAFRAMAVGPLTDAVPVSRVKWRTALVAGWLFLLVFVLWKHGFVRADLYHMGFFFGVLPVLVLSLELFPFSRRSMQLCSRGLALACCLLTVLTLKSLFFSSFGSSLLQPFAGLRGNLNALWRHADYERCQQELYTDAQKAADLPRVTQAIGPASLDVFGQRQCYAIFNKLNYHARPVFQSYLAFNQRLSSLNERFYLSPDAPRFVLFELSGSEHRFPPLEDARLLRHLLLNFRPVMTEKPFLLLESNSSIPAKLHLLHDDVAQFDERLALPMISEGLLWIEIRLEPSWQGRLRQIFLKPSTVRVAFWEKDAKSPLTRSQAPAPMLASGFVASPLLIKTQDVQQFLDASRSIRPFELSLELSPETKRYWKPAFRFKIYSVKKTPDTETRPEAKVASEPLARTQWGIVSDVQCALASPHP